MKHRLVLTRGEIDLLVRRKLAAEGKIPEYYGDATVGSTRYLACLTAADMVAVPAPDAPWGEWPAYIIEWEEEAPA